MVLSPELESPVSQCQVLAEAGPSCRQTPDFVTEEVTQVEGSYRIQI